MDVREAFTRLAGLLEGRPYQELYELVTFILINKGDPELGIKSLIDVIDEAYNG